MVRHVLSSVGIAMVYGLHSLIHGRGKRFFCIPRRLGPTKPPIQWIGGVLSPGVSVRGMKLTTHLHLVPRSRRLELYLCSPTRLHGHATPPASKNNDLRSEDGEVKKSAPHPLTHEETGGSVNIGL
jgi:hypothetical protein